MSKMHSRLRNTLFTTDKAEGAVEMMKGLLKIHVLVEPVTFYYVYELLVMYPLHCWRLDRNSEQINLKFLKVTPSVAICN